MNRLTNMTIDNTHFKIPAATLVSDDEIVGYIAEMNEREDPEEGMVPHRVRRFEKFERMLLPLSWLRDEDKREQVSASLVSFYTSEPGSSAPPIIIDGIDRAIIDGFHRFNAAIERGDTHICAYVGKSPRPSWKPWQEPTHRKFGPR